MATVDLTDVTVLHVDDDPSFGDMVATFLDREAPSFDVHTVDGASDCLEMLSAGGIDCIVSDYDMPRRNGLDLLRQVRESYPDLPFILFTGKGSEEIASEAISAGVTDYLQKETNTEQYTVLANRIKNAVRAAKTRRELEQREREYRAMMDQSPIPTVLFDSENRIVYANPSAAEYAGVDGPADMVGESAVAFVHPDDKDASAERIQRAVEEREGVPEREYRIAGQDGVTRYARGTIVPATFEGEPVAQVVLVDISEYKT
jgi:PAS domain S-box-containing protein